MPLQIGAADVAFPRLNMLSYWLFLFGSIQAVAGFLTPGGAASFGWTAYAPLANSTYSPGIGGDLWVMGLAISGLGTILGGVNFITTIFTMRAPGMTMFRMSIFSWNVLLTSILVPIWHASLRSCKRRSHAVATLVLVLWAPRGLYLGSTILRNRNRNLAGL
jgi:cytochrome c oxidase subunit I